MPEMNIQSVILIRIPNVNLDIRQSTELLQPHVDRKRFRMHLCHGVDAQETYVYLTDPALAVSAETAADDASADIDLNALTANVIGQYPDASIDQFQITLDLQGAAQGQSPEWHYVVETDVNDSAEDDFNQWYIQEHMPGLAAVPGTVRTMRLFNRDAAPRYHALYLLQTKETFGSAPWLAVRATDWSSRVRPNFKNTKRTMFKIIAEGIQ